MFDQHICILLEQYQLKLVRYLIRLNSQLKGSQLVVPRNFETHINIAKINISLMLALFNANKLNCCVPKGHDSPPSRTRDSKDNQNHFKSLLASLM